MMLTWNLFSVSQDPVSLNYLFVRLVVLFLCYYFLKGQPSLSCFVLPCVDYWFMFTVTSLFDLIYLLGKQFTYGYVI